MFLLVSVRHVGAHPGEHQHGVSIQISISLGKTFLRISRIRNIPLTWILARVFVYLPPFISQILDFICRMVLIFILIYFEWRDTENQQFTSALPIQRIISLTVWKLRKLNIHGLGSTASSFKKLCNSFCQHFTYYYLLFEIVFVKYVHYELLHKYTLVWTGS